MKVVLQMYKNQPIILTASKVSVWDDDKLKG